MLTTFHMPCQRRSQNYLNPALWYTIYGSILIIWLCCLYAAVNNFNRNDKNIFISLKKFSTRSFFYSRLAFVVPLHYSTIDTWCHLYRKSMTFLCRHIKRHKLCMVECYGHYRYQVVFVNNFLLTFSSLKAVST